VSIEAQGWAGMPISLDLRLQVYDSSGAAGVTIDLVRLAVSAHRSSSGGFVEAAALFLKSPPGTST
jgi:myo-inositol-1-phosphate synthase